MHCLKIWWHQRKRKIFLWFINIWNYIVDRINLSFFVFNHCITMQRVNLFMSLKESKLWNTIFTLLNIYTWKTVSWWKNKKEVASVSRLQKLWLNLWTFKWLSPNRGQINNLRLLVSTNWKTMFFRNVKKNTINFTIGIALKGRKYIMCYSK